MKRHVSSQACRKILNISTEKNSFKNIAKFTYLSSHLHSTIILKYSFYGMFYTLRFIPFSFISPKGCLPYRKCSSSKTKFLRMPLLCQSMVCRTPPYSIHPSIISRVFPKFVFSLVDTLGFSVSVYCLAFSLHVQTIITVFIQLLVTYSSLHPLLLLFSHIQDRLSVILFSVRVTL